MVGGRPQVDGWRIEAGLIGLVMAIALRHLDIPPRKRYAWEDEKGEHEDK